MRFSLVLLCGWLSLANTAAAESPNILLILVDDLGYGDLSSYGSQEVQSPGIDALTKRGMRFDAFYANCPVCSPTRASLLTGRYPELAGVPGVIRTHPTNSWGFLSPEATLLPKVLRASGYHTAMVGKWHLGLQSPNLPNERGFDHFHGFLGDMMDDYYHHRRHGNNYMRDNRKTINPEGHATDLFTEWACEYLRSRKAEESPFFLYLAYNAPHTPIQPPQDWLEKVKRRHPSMPNARAKLVALIEHMDEGIGRVLKTLEETGLSKDTLVVFSSDNGGQLNVGASNAPWRDGKQSMYEGGLLVPTCVVWPGNIEPGSRSQVNGITMDFFPTLCEAAGASFEFSVDGISLLPVLTGKSESLPERDLFFTRREGGTRYQGLTIQAVRSGPWKLLQNSPFAPFELYNLAEDPGEQTDSSKKNPKEFQRLSALLRQQIQRGGRVPWQRGER